MNKVLLIGRLTKDTEARYTSDNKCVARNTLAVDRRFGEGADFISIVSFGKTAEFLEKYGKKGVKFGMEGRINTGSYEKDGKKVYTTDVIVDAVEFAESKKNESPAGNAPEPPAADEFMQADMEGLPFM